MTARQHPMARVYDNLDWLREHGALAGVAEIIRERRRQIEKGWTPEWAGMLASRRPVEQPKNDHGSPSSGGR